MAWICFWILASPCSCFSLFFFSFLKDHRCKAKARRRSCDGFGWKVGVQLTCDYLINRRSLWATACDEKCSLPSCMKKRTKQDLKKFFKSGGMLEVVAVTTRFKMVSYLNPNQTNFVDLVTDCKCQLSMKTFAACLRDSSGRERKLRSNWPFLKVENVMWAEMARANKLLWNCVMKVLPNVVYFKTPSPFQKLNRKKSIRNN